MRRFFKILEKIVWALVVVAIIIVLVLFAIGIFANFDTVYNYARPFFIYVIIVAAIFFVFMASIWSANKHFESRIKKEIKHLQKANDDYVLLLANQIADDKVAVEKQKLELEYQKKEAALNERALTVDDVLKKHDALEKIRMEIVQKEQEERELRLKNTEEYVTLIFSLAKCPVEDVEKVWQVTKLFIESGHVVADKQFKIAHNKKLRNAELWQFAKNIVKYNQKESLDVETYLMITFGEWFTGNKENLAKNNSNLPKDSLVSKDGVEADLKRLRSMVSPSTDIPKNKVQDADF